MARKKDELVELATKLGVKDADSMTVATLELIVGGAEAKAEADKLKADNIELQELNEGLLDHQAQLDKEKKLGKPTVKIDKVLYQLPFEKMSLSKAQAAKLGVSEVTRQLVKEDKKLQAYLLKVNSGFLVKID